MSGGGKLGAQGGGGELAVVGGGRKIGGSWRGKGNCTFVKCTI